MSQSKQHMVARHVEMGLRAIITRSKEKVVLNKLCNVELTALEEAIADVSLEEGEKVNVRYLNTLLYS